MRSTGVLSLAIVAPLLVTRGAPAATVKLPFYGEVEVIDAIDCTSTDHLFREYPAGASRVEEILGKPCRTMPVQDDTSSYLAWRLGEGKGIVPDAAYVVALEYPDDLPRNYVVRNNGNESRRSFYTGAAIGDPWEADGPAHLPESLRIPQSGRYALWAALTFPGQFAKTLDESAKIDIAKDGFDIILAHYKRKHDPISAGLAVRRILLCKIPNEAALQAKITYPPAPLPRRHIFWREEMSDGSALGADGLCPANHGLNWFEQKMRTMRILGQNTFCKDLLEFGHNQHWDPNWKHGQPGAKSWKWMWACNEFHSDLWASIVPLAVDKYGFDILPYYEYGGAAGDPSFALGPQKRSEPLDPDNKPGRAERGANFTQIWWSEGKLRVDITDPDTLAELKYILDGTILRFKDQVAKGGFLGAFMRPRHGEWAIGFGDATRARFAAEANDGRAVSRADLKADRALYDRYLAWWGGKRAAFVEAIRAYLETNGVRNAVVVFENDPSETGHGLLNHEYEVVTDDPATWSPLVAGKVFDSHNPSILSDHLCLARQTSLTSTWGAWEWQHASPPADPALYKPLHNVWITMPVHKTYTVTDPAYFDAFRNGDGTDTLIFHYGLNENMVKDAAGEPLIGYAMADFERAGRACMLSEVTAMANGDPVNLGYLMGSNYTRGFPGPVQEFNRNFLALPALPSKRLDGAASDSETTVRLIDTGRTGKYFIVAHTGLLPKTDVRLRLPANVEQLIDIDGHTFSVQDGVATLPALQPVQLLVLRAK